MARPFYNFTPRKGQGSQGLEIHKIMIFFSYIVLSTSAKTFLCILILLTPGKGQGSQDVQKSVLKNCDIFTKIVFAQILFSTSKT